MSCSKAERQYDSTNEKYNVATRLPVKDDLVAVIRQTTFLGRQNLTDTFYLNLKDDAFNLNDICEYMC